jgi:hypothetical protein
VLAPFQHTVHRDRRQRRFEGERQVELVVHATQQIFGREFRIDAEQLD